MAKIPNEMAKVQNEMAKVPCAKTDVGMHHLSTHEFIKMSRIQRSRNEACSTSMHLVKGKYARLATFTITMILTGKCDRHKLTRSNLTLISGTEIV